MSALTAKDLGAAILCLLLAGATLSGCEESDQDGASGFRCIQRGYRNFCRVYHDDKRAVTCWSLQGPSCIPDAQLASAASAAKPPPEKSP